MRTVGDPQAWDGDPASAWALVLPLCPHCLHMKLRGWTKWLCKSLIARMFCDLVLLPIFHMGETLLNTEGKWGQIRVWWALSAPWNTCWNGVQGNLQIINGSGTSADSEVEDFFLHISFPKFECWQHFYFCFFCSDTLAIYPWGIDILVPRTFSWYYSVQYILYGV